MGGPGEAIGRYWESLTILKDSVNRKMELIALASEKSMQFCSANKVDSSFLVNLLCAKYKAFTINNCANNIISFVVGIETSSFRQSRRGLDVILIQVSQDFSFLSATQHIKYIKLSHLYKMILRGPRYASKSTFEHFSL
jgi:hypothetical protein